MSSAETHDLLVTYKIFVCVRECKCHDVHDAAFYQVYVRCRDYRSRVKKKFVGHVVKVNFEAAITSTDGGKYLRVSSHSNDSLDLPD